MPKRPCRARPTPSSRDARGTNRTPRRRRERRARPPFLPFRSCERASEAVAPRVESPSRRRRSARRRPDGEGVDPRGEGQGAHAQYLRARDSGASVEPEIDAGRARGRRPRRPRASSCENGSAARGGERLEPISKSGRFPGMDLRRAGAKTRKRAATKPGSVTPSRRRHGKEGARDVPPA